MYSNNGGCVCAQITLFLSPTGRGTCTQEWRVHNSSSRTIRGSDFFFSTHAGRQSGTHIHFVYTCCVKRKLAGDVGTNFFCVIWKGRVLGRGAKGAFRGRAGIRMASNSILDCVALLLVSLSTPPRRGSEKRFFLLSCFVVVSSSFFFFFVSSSCVCVILFFMSNSSLDCCFGERRDFFGRATGARF